MLIGKIRMNIGRSYDSTKTQNTMRKAFFAMVVLFLMSQASHAQTEKGSQSLRLNLEFNYNNTSGIYVDPYDYHLHLQEAKIPPSTLGRPTVILLTISSTWAHLYLMGITMSPMRILKSIQLRNTLTLLLLLIFEKIFHVWR